MTEQPGYPTEPPVVPADWYQVGPMLRYWDGEAWTHHTAPPPPAHLASQAASPVQPTQHQQVHAGPLMTFASHIHGKNAQVTISVTRFG